MVLSNVAGWYSFSGAGNYFLILSPFVVYLYSLVVLAFNEKASKVINNSSDKFKS